MKFKNVLDKTLNWLKYIAFSFFHNGYAREGAKSSTLNFFFGVVVAFVLICGGLTAGYNTSFDDHYYDADGFRQFVHNAFDSASLSVKDGKLNLSGADRLETLSDKNSALRVNGYELVIDTRPAETYDDFAIICKDGDGKEISYEEYLQLSDADKRKYTLNLKYSGNTLDTAAKQDEYRAYLDEVSTEGGNKYNESVAKEYAGIKESGLEGYALYDKIYLLYARCYYPSFEKVEKYASVPTVRSYYISKLSESEDGKYLVLFDERCMFSFYTDSGIMMTFSGEYGAEDGEIKGADAADSLLLGAFGKNASMNFLVFASDLFVSVLIFVILTLLISFICSKLLKKSGLEYSGSSELFHIFGGFLPVAGLIAFVCGIGLPYALSVQTAYLATRLIFLGVVYVRFAVLIAMDAVTAKKQVAAPASEEQPSDPFEHESVQEGAEEEIVTGENNDE